jgi:spermidine/putrescine transport system permease protein
MTAAARLQRNTLRGCAIVVYAFLYAPILAVVAYSFNAAKRGARWEGFTGHWYARLLRDESMHDAVVNSLIVAAVATVISIFIGTAAALGLRKLAPGKGVATRGLLYLPIVLPDIVLGVALLSFFAMCGMRLSLATIILAHVGFTVSYAAIVVRARLAGIDPSLEEAARDLGAGPLGTFVRVTLPLIAPGVVAAALLVFTISLDDYVVTSLVAGPGAGTLPLKIYGMVRVEVTPEVNATCTVVLAFTLILVGLANWLLAAKRA